MHTLLNSSWHWLTTSVMPIFPVAVLLTLLIECSLIIAISRIQKIGKAVAIIVIANIASFAMPYLFKAVTLIGDFGWDYRGNSLIAVFEAGPFYIIGVFYLVLTALVEVPIVYLSLRQDAGKPKSLLASVVLVNVFTTTLIAIVERTISVGSW